MQRNTYSSFFLAAFVAAGCSALFGIDDTPARKPSPGSGGKGGSAGKQGGTTSGGTSNGGTNQAGEGGEPGPSGAGGEATGGRIDTGGSSGRDSGGAGASGEGGDIDVFPDPGSPCAPEGALACLASANRGRLICEGGLWRSGPRCEMDERCDRRTGACGRIQTHCLGPAGAMGRKCAGSASMGCGPDLVTATFVEDCLFGCDTDTGRCTPPDGDALIVDRPPPIQSITRWPVSVIPVCVHDAAAPAWDTIRALVDGSVGRYSSITFSDWNDCDEAGPAVHGGVEVSLASNCLGELGSVSRFGYPGPSNRTRMTICESYYDAGMQLQTASAPLLRLSANHLFGHVLGLEDDAYPYIFTFMDRVFHSTALDGYERDEFVAISDIQNAYGSKPWGSLVGATGRCVAGSGSAFSAKHCDGSSDRSWHAELGRLALPAGCLRAPSGAALLLDDACGLTPEFSWRPDHVRWMGPGGLCVTPTTTGTALETKRCEAFGTAQQTWTFEFLEGDRLRIHQPDGGPCVQVPNVVPPGAPELANCDGSGEEFRITAAGQIATSGYCMTQHGYDVTFAPCVVDWEQSYYLSGPFENELGNLELTPEGTLVTGTRAGVPTAAQTFDFHF